MFIIFFCCSLHTGMAFHELTLECKFDYGDDVIDEEEEGGNRGILARDLYLVGASWDRERNMVSGKTVDSA